MTTQRERDEDTDAGKLAVLLHKPFLTAKERTFYAALVRDKNKKGTTEESKNQTEDSRHSLHGRQNGTCGID